MAASALSKSPEYQSFRSSVQQKKVVVDKSDDKVWTIYDAGPRSVRCPLICLPPVSGTADIFFKQILTLSTLGYRVISVGYPIYWSMEEFCQGFRRLIDHLGLDKVHLFGASLGGFLAQKFAESVSEYLIVHSLILCNAFCDTTVFQYTDAASMFWVMPSFLLKRLVMGSFPRREVDSEIADSLDFMVEKLDSLGQQELAARLTLNCNSSYVDPAKTRHLDVTLIDVFDECALSQGVKEAMYKLYPDAKLAHIKSGGNFPYLSRSAEVNVHLQVHLRKYNGTKYSAREGVSPTSPPFDSSPLGVFEGGELQELDSGDMADAQDDRPHNQVDAFVRVRPTGTEDSYDSSDTAVEAGQDVTNAQGDSSGVLTGGGGDAGVAVVSEEEEQDIFTPEEKDEDADIFLP